LGGLAGFTTDGTSAAITNPFYIQGPIIEPPYALTDSTNIATDATVGSFFKVILGDNRTLSFPTSPSDGQIIRWQIIQDGTGGRTLTLDGGFKTGPFDVTLSTAANAVDYLSAIYYSTGTSMHVVAFIAGYS